MAKFAEMVKENETAGKHWKCENCKEKITNSEIKLVDPIDNFEILTPMLTFLFIDKNDVITGGGKMASKEKGDKVFACPHCDHVHLYGLEPW